MKRVLPVAAVLLAAASWTFAVTRSPETAPRMELAAVSAAAPVQPVNAPHAQDGEALSEVNESTERFQTVCGWCDPQVSELGGTCFGFCGDRSSSVSCTAAGEGEGAVDALLSREQKHRSLLEGIREVWVRVSGSGTRVSDLARHLRSLSGWKVDVPPLLEPIVVREGDLHAPWSGLSSRTLALADGRKLRIHGDRDRHIFELRAVGSTG